MIGRVCCCSVGFWSCLWCFVWEKGLGGCGVLCVGFGEEV